MCKLANKIFSNFSYLFQGKKIKIKINKSDFCLIICYICFINFLTPKLGGSEVKLADMSKKTKKKLVYLKMILEFLLRTSNDFKLFDDLRMSLTNPFYLIS